MDGYLTWDSGFATTRFLKDPPHLAGFDFTAPNDNLPEGIEWSPQDEEAVFVIPTKARTHRVQQVALGTNAPRTRMAWNFRVRLLAQSETEYFKILEAAQRGATVNWVPFCWLVEIFDVTDGSAYTLSRPVAWSISGNANSTNHPTYMELDGVPESAPGSGDFGVVSGQTLTAADDGRLCVRYLPAFKVICANPSSAVPVTGGLEFSLDLMEAISLA